jgi:Na+/melibiose symporter-like transporter
MQFLISTATLPMVAKPIYGIISDSIFIGGSHRVPYLVLAGNGFAITQVLHFVIPCALEWQLKAP